MATVGSAALLGNSFGVFSERCGIAVARAAPPAAALPVGEPGVVRRGALVCGPAGARPVVVPRECSPGDSGAAPASSGGACRGGVRAEGATVGFAAELGGTAALAAPADVGRGAGAVVAVGCGYVPLVVDDSGLRRAPGVTRAEAAPGFGRAVAVFVGGVPGVVFVGDVPGVAGFEGAAVAVAAGAAAAVAAGGMAAGELAAAGFAGMAGWGVAG